MDGKCSKHMIKKGNAGRNLGIPCSVEVELDIDIGFFCVSGNFSLSSHKNILENKFKLL